MTAETSSGGAATDGTTDVQAHRTRRPGRWRTRGRIPPADHLVGEPIDLSALRAEVRAGRPLNAELLRETTDLMMSRVRDQLGDLRGERPPLTLHPGPGRRRPDGLAGSAA